VKKIETENMMQLTCKNVRHDVQKDFCTRPGKWIDWHTCMYTVTGKIAGKYCIKFIVTGVKNASFCSPDSSAAKQVTDI
jgi:hypothetical protein